MLTPKNARGRPVTKLCLALETFRRTDEGRVRDAKAFLAHFFPQDKNGTRDRIFVHMPNEVRADLLSNWGIRGKKSALRDDDDRVRTTVGDALNAGDIDAPVIEEGITPDILTDWVPLEDWWSFWRGSVLPAGSVRKALALARDLSLFDERWFFEHLALKTQKLEGIDVVCSALSKEQIVAWIAAVHQTGDASPTGLVAAIGWETILAKTAHEGLLFALDALARQIGLAESGPDDRKSDLPSARRSDPPGATPSAMAAFESSAVQPELVISKPAPLPTPPGAQSKAESLPPPPPQKSASLPPPRPSEPLISSPPPAKVEPIRPQKPAEPQAAPLSAKPPIPISTKSPESTQPGAMSKPPPVPVSSKQPPAMSKPPPVPASSKPSPQTSKPPPIPSGAAPANAAISKPPQRPPASVAPAAHDLPSVIIEDDPFFPAPPAAVASVVPTAPASTPPNARSLFLGAAAEPPPMRPPAATIMGVAPPALFGGETDEVAMPTFSVPPVSDPEWAPSRAEPGDMGWDLVHGVTRPMGTNVQPKYNFTEEDDEPTSEINLPTDIVRRR